MNDSTEPLGGATSATAVATGNAPSNVPHGVAQARSLFDRQILGQAIIDSFKKLDPASRCATR